MCDPSNSNRVEEHEYVAVFNGQAQRDLGITMQLEEVFETLGWDDCVSAPSKTESKSVSRQSNLNNPMPLSPVDEFGIKNKNMCLVCKNKFVEGGGEISLCDHD